MTSYDDIVDAVQLLKDKRGRQDVTFADVADHLMDFARRSPADAEPMARLARFLAAVEDLPHRHEEPRHGALRPAG